MPKKARKPISEIELTTCPECELTLKECLTNFKKEGGCCPTCRRIGRDKAHSWAERSDTGWPMDNDFDRGLREYKQRLKDAEN